MLDNIIEILVVSLLILLILVIWLTPVKVKPINGRRKFKQKKGREDEWY